MKAKITIAVLSLLVFVGHLGLLLGIGESVKAMSGPDGSALGFAVAIVCFITFFLSVGFGLATHFYIARKTALGKKAALMRTLPAMLFPPISTWFFLNPNHVLFGLLNGSLIVQIAALTLPFIIVIASSKSTKGTMKKWILEQLYEQ